MIKAKFKCAVSMTVLILVMTAALAYGEALQPAQITPDQQNQLVWSVNSRGIQELVIIGNPGNAGMYVVRSKYAAGLRIQPHFHPDDRIVTVLSGTIYLGYGKTFEEKKMKALPPGSIWTEPANQPHYSWAKDGEVLIQIIGRGPSGVTPVRP
ncbi:MAG: cupin domain-containing protein [Deltaproteobacteria bacterium]